MVLLSQSNAAWSNSIVSDGSLPNPTIVMGSLITGGTKSGVNLFHSFDRFSVQMGDRAIFQSGSGIQNIITRVTGLSRSVIDGEIQAPGNFFLINPNGITFGASASLNIGGSFFATTAPMLRFSDGTTFGSDRGIAPVLSVNVPIGVQWGSQPSGEIQNFGNLAVPESFSLVAPKIAFNQAIATGASLDIQAPTQLLLNDSQLTTSNGGSLSLQVGDLTARSSLISSSYFTTSDVSQPRKLVIQGTGDLVFDRLSSVEAKTFLGVTNPGNDIQISGKSIVLRNGSTITTQSLENTRSGNIKLSAPEIMIGKGTAVKTQTSGSGRGGDIALQGNQIEVRDGAIVSTDTNGSGDGGNLSALGQDIRILNGGQLRSISSGDGNSGRILVDASDRILIIGNSDYDLVSAFLINSISTISASIRYIPASQLPPNSDPRGILLLNNPLYSSEPFIIPVSVNIALNDKYTGIKASSYGGGKAGNIDLQAPLVEAYSFSLISNISTGFGDSAKVSIQAKTVNLDSSSILTSAIRSKNGGIVEITTDNLTNRSTNILSSVVEGDGGMITLNVRDRLTLSQNSNITARSANFGKGGVIRINNANGFIVAERNGNNDILATASVGRGGIISIRSAGLFNIVPRSIQTLGNDLLASSDTGIQGTITLDRTQQELAPTSPKLSEAILDRSASIMPSCPSIVRDNRLIITGQGGRTLSAAETVNLLSLDTEENSKSSIPDDRPAVLTEATHWKHQSDGSIVLLPGQISTPPLIAANCSKLINDRSPTP